jgi:hypothetical protein
VWLFDYRRQRQFRWRRSFRLGLGPGTHADIDFVSVLAFQAGLEGAGLGEGIEISPLGLRLAVIGLAGG